MAPIVNGQMYPALREQLLDPHEFNVLILGTLSVPHLMLISKIEVLHNYIDDKIGDHTRIRLHSIKSAKRNAIEMYQPVEPHELETVTAETVMKLAADEDIDVILDAGKLFTKKQATDCQESYLVVSTLEDLEAKCETFLIGRNIAWLFQNPTWNTTIFTRYYMRQGLCSDCMAFMGEASKLGYTSDQIDRVRYLSNRIGQIEYSKDVLNSFLQKKRRAHRHGITDQTYNFELNYHLSNYYFLISGGLDIIARILNDVYSLGLTRFSELGLEKDALLKALKKDHDEFAKIYGEEKVKEWIEWLKERRNYVAHEGGVHHTPIVQEKKVKMTPEELEKKIDAQTDWPLMKSMLTPEQYQAHREMVANIVKMDDYEQVAADAMIVKTNGAKKVFFPLRDIDYDYDHFKDVVAKTINDLKAK